MPKAEAMTAIRSPAVAGTFYPADPVALRRQVAGFLAEADDAPPDDRLPKAIIAPHAGYIYSGPCRRPRLCAAAHGDAAGSAASC